MIKPLAVVALLIALPVGAQTNLVEQGRAALDKNDLQAAVRLLESAVAQSPQNAEAHYQLGVAYGELAKKANVFQRFSLARHTRDEFERAVQLDPNYIDARFALVQYYMMAPAWLGGSEAKALEQAKEISDRDATTGHLALAFIDARQKKSKQSAAQGAH